MKDFTGIGVIGAGARGQYVVGNLLRESGRKVKILAVYDPDKNEAKRAVGLWDSPDCRICDSSDEVIAASGVEWIMIFSPNVYHREHITAAFAAGKHVFSEKPLASTFEDCRLIYQSHLEHPELQFATGFVLRYAPIYRKVHELLTSGRLGKVLMVQANENISPVHGTYMMAGWRRQSSESGPHLLEKCCHDLDLLMWFCGAKPSKVTGFGKLAFFTAENQFLMEKYGRNAFYDDYDIRWRNPHAAPSPFTCEKDIIDTQGATAILRNGVIINFMATMSNPKPERRMYFSCTEGTLIVELYSLTLTWRGLNDTQETTIVFDGDMHGGGDSCIMRELFDTMTNGTPPVCSGNEGLDSAVFALAMAQAVAEGGIVDIEPYWATLGR